MTLAELVDRFEARRVGKTYRARCPGHADAVASLSLGAGDEGRLLVHCHAGCSVEAVLEAAGLTLADLGPPGAAARRAGANGRPRPEIVATYRYVDELRALLYESVRLHPKGFRQRRPDGAGDWIWNLAGVRRVLYRLPELVGASRVYICEGEKDTDALVARGRVATTNCGGAGKWLSVYTDQLVAAGVNEIIILPDNDEPGRQHAELVARACREANLDVYIVPLPGLPAKGDVSDFLALHTIEELEAIVDAALHPPAIVLSEVLDQIAAFIRAYVVLSNDQLVLVVLWVAHTYTLEAFDATPYLQVTSATAEAGKTRLLEVLECVVAKPWLTQRTSAGVLVRKIDAERPTLLLDESDAAFHGNPEYAEALRGLLNAGYRRSGKASLCVGQGAALTYKDFSVFGPKAIAGIGELPDTVASRSIRIELQRRTKDEPVAKFRQRHAPREAAAMRRTLEAWSSSAIEPLRRAAPDMPIGLRDRAEDVLEPLLAIADLAGQAWPDRARQAAVAIMTAPTTTNLNLELLSDIRLVFEETDDEWLASKALVEALVKMEDAPWATVRRDDKPLTPHFLATHLKGFQIAPGHTKTARGYRRAAFAEPWQRYLPPLQPSPRHQPNDYAGESPFSDRHPESTGDDLKSEVSPMNTGLGDGVTVAKGGRGPNEQYTGAADPWRDTPRPPGSVEAAVAVDATLTTKRGRGKTGGS